MTEEITAEVNMNGNATEPDDDNLPGKNRPADIDADLREMERRKRVDIIMNSRMFREELERIIESQLRDGTGGASSILQKITDMMGKCVVKKNSTLCP